MAHERKQSNKVFLTIDEIKENFSAYQVFDARYNLKIKNHGKLEYAKGHVEGAILLDVDVDLCAPLEGTTARHPMPAATQFVDWCKSRGISQERPVLVYDDDCGAMGACRLWWMLDALGVEAYVVDGGIQACRAGGLPMESGESEARLTPTTFWPFGTDFKKCITREEIPPNATLADARSAARFNTTVRPYGGDVLPGHIEGARNLPYESHLRTTGDVKHLRAWDEIRSNVLRVMDGAWPHGQSPDLTNCVFYCGSGLSGAMNIAVVRQLGLGSPLFYCNSWSEYAGVFRTPITRHIVCAHGMWFEMLSPNLGDNKKVDVDFNSLRVDGSECKDLDNEIKAAAQHLHVGEIARVHFKSGRIATIEVPVHH